MNQQDEVMGDNPEESRQSAASESDTLGVRVPPPLIYLTSILIGAAIDRLTPVRVLPDLVTGWLGGALVLLAVTISGFSVREFRKAKTTFRVDRPVSALITTGPFRYSRNPLYLSLSILQAGIGIWMNSVWVVVLLVPTVAVMTRGVIVREEKYLAEKFGKAYRDYQATVRRWL